MPISLIYNSGLLPGDFNQMTDTHTLLVPVAAGELIDKITILRLKASRLQQPDALANVQRELAALEHEQQNASPALLSQELRGLTLELQKVNTDLWNVEDALRLHEADQSFENDFITLARSVYRLNDERAAIKRRINLTCGSTLIEEKSYGQQKPPIKEAEDSTTSQRFA